MPTALESILAATRRRVSGAKRTADLRALERKAAAHTPRGFRTRLRAAAQNGPAVIAELKKASPSKGLIRGDFHPEGLARELASAGAAALSVLTDEEFFQGSLRNLEAASAAASLPCLRKDFMVDEFQFLESRAHGADAVLLIVAALEQRELAAFARIAASHELDVVCEVHDEAELQRASDAGCQIIGVNSRNLKTFDVELETAFRLAAMIPPGCLRVAESGIDCGADIGRLRGAGYDAFLIGESLMRAARPGDALRILLEESKTVVSSS